MSSAGLGMIWNFSSLTAKSCADPTVESICQLRAGILEESSEVYGGRQSMGGGDGDTSIRPMSLWVVWWSCLQM